jgi:hypothetical protein
MQDFQPESTTMVPNPAKVQEFFAIFVDLAKTGLESCIIALILVFLPFPSEKIALLQFFVIGASMAQRSVNCGKIPPRRRK